MRAATYYLKIKQAAKAFVVYGRHAWRFRLLARLSPCYPSVINFPITRRCNSKCIMCNVWKEQSPNELNPAALAEILQDPLFKRVRSVGLSGGEPTLRSDLIELAEVMIERLPKLKGISLITNGLQPNVVENKILQLRDLCRRRKVHFSIMLSVDGIGATHDRIRGTPGAFSRVTESIDKIKKIGGLSFGLCCTISPQNVGQLDSVLQFAQHQGLPIKFRLATEIDRLHNRDCVERITLTEEQRHQAAQFLEKIAVMVEKDWERIQFYWSLRDMLALNHTRKAACQWARDGVTLDETGNLYYCAVKSPALGQTAAGPRRLYFDKKNLAQRRQIEKQSCSTCLHDYPTVLGWGVLREIIKRIWRRLVRDPWGDWFVWLRARWGRGIDRRPAGKKNLKRVLMTGWFGTETTGDKAILAGIIGGLRGRFGPAAFDIISYNPFYSQRTLNELNISDANIIPFCGRAIRRAVKKADLVLMGGGPLMDIRDTFDVLRVMKRAATERKVSMLYGVGFGPLNQKKIWSAAQQVARYSTVITVRDQLSLETLRGMNEGNQARVTVDPAWTFLRSLPKPKLQPGKVFTIGVSLRSWPENYAYGFSKTDYRRRADDLPRIIAELINRVHEKEHVSFIFVPMNTFYVGGDDRELFAQVLALAANPDQVSILGGTGAPQQVAEAIAGCDLFIGMRFHSIVFAAAMEVPMIALDYTAGRGKISGFMEMIGHQDAVLSLETLSLETLESKLGEFRAHWQERRQKISAAVTKLDPQGQENARILDSWFIPKEDT